MVVRVRGGRVYLSTGYNDGLRKGAKELGGIWDSKKKSWMFDAHQE